MQPRLVAISYPASPDVGNPESSVSSRKRSRSDRLSASSSRLSMSLRRVSIPDFSHVWKRPSVDDKVTFNVLQPWAEEPRNYSDRQNETMFNRKHGPSWQTLPINVQKDILEHLKLVNEDPSSDEYPGSLQNDLMSVQLSCKAWAPLAQRYLYETVRLKSLDRCDHCDMIPKRRYLRILHFRRNRENHLDHVRTFHHTQICQLRRTVRLNPRIGKLVKNLVLLPAKQHDEAEFNLYSDLVASIVMACPRLETFSGCYILYTHNFNRLFHALSTRSSLRQHTWVVGEDSAVQSRAGRRFRSGILSYQQTRQFLQHHAHWGNLETLNMVSHNGRGILEHNLFISTLNMLPSLQNLRVSSFDPNDFSSETLLSLPRLKSLTLDQCLGVSERGLCLWAESEAASEVQKVVLENQKVTSLLTISTMFASLDNLEIFHIGQTDFEPTLPLEFDVEEPLLASQSLKVLEWCISNHTEPEKQEPMQVDIAQINRRSSYKSSQHLLCSILDAGFPQLQKIVLPGYGNLSGLLRWLRHTSWARKNKIPRSQHTSAIASPASTASFPRTRQTLRHSMRPSSPTFDQYDQWKSPRGLDPVLAEQEDDEEESTQASPEILEQEEEELPSPGPSIPTTATSQQSTRRNSPAGSFNYDSNRSSMIDGSSISTSTSTPSPRSVNFFRMSTSTTSLPSMTSMSYTDIETTAGDLIIRSERPMIVELDDRRGRSPKSPTFLQNEEEKRRSVSCSRVGEISSMLERFAWTL